MEVLRQRLRVRQSEVERSWDATGLSRIAMYDFYIYASYELTAFALGAIIAVSFRVCHAHVNASPPCRHAKWRRLKTVSLTSLAAHAGGFRVFGLFYIALFAGDPTRLPSALTGQKVPDFACPDSKPTVRVAQQ